MLSESLIIGLVVLLMCGAVSFYMYVRLTFLEKKMGVMESIIVDIRVALDSIMMEHAHHPPPLPISQTPGAQLSAPAPLSSSESENIPEEKFYSSVLEQAHEKVEEGVTAEKALESFDDADTAEAVPSAPSAPSANAVPNIDAMTRQELVTLAESKGLRVKRNMNRTEVIALLRRSAPTQNDVNTTGTENVSGSTGNTLQAGASLDGSLPVDLNQNGAPVEVAI